MLALRNTHPRDSRIQFEEEGHKYFIDDRPASASGYISTTTLVHKLFPAFDADVVIAKMRTSKRWGDSKYNGLTDDEIKLLWDKNRSAAASAGTQMHANLELYANDQPHDTDTKEFQLFESFVRDNPDLKPYRSEWLIFDEESGISGSVDMVYTTGDGEFVLCDFKRSKEIRRWNPWEKGCSPTTEGLDNCNYNHYSLQLGIYTAILEKNYGITIRESFLLVLHPDQDTYLKINTLDVSKEVAEIMAWRKASRVPATEN